MKMPSPYFVGFMVLVALIAFISGVIIGTASSAVQETVGTLPRPEFGTYPPDCDKHVVEYIESDWNEETESYPTNHAWIECMGVGLVVSAQMYREDI